VGTVADCCERGEQWLTVVNVGINVHASYNIELYVIHPEVLSNTVIKY